ncbi:MAG: AAA family ATPase [Syntrophobacteraceae bacterium]|nr:AAA family ATPase [Syntrophobacteraceae bacterium]
MKYSSGIQITMALAQNEATAGEFREIQPEHVLMAILKLSEMDGDILEKSLGNMVPLDLLKEEHRGIRELLRSRALDSKPLRRNLRNLLGNGGFPPRGAGLHRSAETRRYFAAAETQAGKEGADVCSCVHLLRALLDSPPPLLAAVFTPRDPRLPEKEPAEGKPAPGGDKPEGEPPDLGGLTELLKELRGKLLAHVFGQDHAVHTFVEGLFNAEVVAVADTARRKPRAVFVFAGPPGVGKTFLAECGAEALGKPYRRFDMSGYSDPMGVVLLAGAQRSYQGAGPGQLTEFVRDNPDSILLFDEIEKAHLSVIHLFLQILDLGGLEDKYLQERIEFRNTILIFTTNAGRSLYDDLDAGGYRGGRAVFHRKTILNALETERDPRTREPFFPQAICSRLATGYPLLFNRLGVYELERIAASELERQGALIEKQYGKPVRFGPTLPFCLVLREGTRSDARTVRSGAEIFVRSEIFRFCSLNTPERLRTIWEEASILRFDLDPAESIEGEVRSLFEPHARFRVLLAGDPDFADPWFRGIQNMDRKTAADFADAQNMLAAGDFDLVLLDLRLGRGGGSKEGSRPQPGTMVQFDHAPVASREIRHGLDLLRLLREKYPELPCYLLSSPGGTSFPKMDEELFLECVRAGQVQGVLDVPDLPFDQTLNGEHPELSVRLHEIARKLYRERTAAELGSQNKALSFDTAPWLSPGGEVHIRLRNLRIVRAAAAEDASELVQDAERPQTRFEDVYGAASAKAELDYIVRWLRDPKQYQQLGLKPPRGILLYGDPGTGKTMLARALAGESRAAFLVESASSFVTKWVGSGPENVRNLFARARRYAPSIVFMDEIDAIGKKREGGPSSRPQEETLNALLTEMDGFGSPTARPVIVLAATNLVEHLDEALKRRFDREIEVDKPDKAAREAFLRSRLQGSPHRQVSNAVIERLAGQSANMTIADLDRIIQAAGRAASRSDGIITDSVIEEAFETMRMGAARGKVGPEALLRVARHEAGHCLIGWLRGEKPVQVTIVARGHAGGYVEGEADEDRMVYTRREIEGIIRQCMGGRAAEILYYGEEDGLSSGVSGDLEQATAWARRMAANYGMGDRIGPVALGHGRFEEGPMAVRVVRESKKIIAAQLDRAIEELTRHRPILDSLVAQLLDRNRLTRQELEALLGEV